MAGQRTALFTNSIVHMDEEAMAINARAEANSQTEAPTVETNAPEVSSEAVQPEKTEKSTETTQIEGERKVTGAEKRIHKLVDERNQFKEKAETLESKLAEYLAGTQSPVGNYPNYQPTNGESQGGERELTLDDLRAIARIEAANHSLAEKAKLEARESMTIHPELDPESDKFDPEITETIANAVNESLRKDPTQSIKKLTEKYMRPFKKAAERAVSEEKKVLTQQVNDEALRPSNVKPTTKPFAEKSLEEMEAELGFVH